MSRKNSQLTLVAQFLRRYPVEMARIVQNSPPGESADLLLALAEKDQALLMERLMPGSLASIFQSLENSQAQQVCKLVRNAQLASALRQMQPARQKDLIDALPIGRRAAIQLLLTYPRGTIGAWMRTDVVVLDEDATVDDLSNRQDEFSPDYPTQFVFILTGDRRLKCAVPLSSAFTATSQTRLVELAVRDFPVQAATTRLIASLESGVWSSADIIGIANSRKEFIGILSHLGLRRALAREEGHREVEQSPDLLVSLMKAYGSSLAALGGSLVESVEEPSRR